MSFDFSPTEREQKILISTRRLLGPSLADYLLSGLGEAQIAHRRAFTAKSAFPDKENPSYRLEMISDSPQGLPVGRDPLVMAVLVGLLRERQPWDDIVSFSMSDMLKILQWPQNKDSHLLVIRAVERYATTSYCLINRPLPEEGSSGSYFRRLVISYETISKPSAVKVKTWQTIIRVQFWPYFINAFIIHCRKYFLGLEFQNLREIQEISC